MMIDDFTVENCHFDLQKYPFDAQICVFGLDLKPEEDEKFTIYGQKEQMISYTGSKDVADFAVVGVSSNITSCVGVGSNVIPVDQELVLCISNFGLGVCLRNIFKVF